MALHFQLSGPYILNSPIQTKEGKFYAIYHDDLRRLHDYARDYLDLDSSDFHTGNTAKGEAPCYLLPQRLHGYAVSNGCTPLSLLDPHLKNVQANLYIQLSGNPSMGAAYQKQIEAEAAEAESIAAARRNYERNRKLTFYSIPNPVGDKAAAAARDRQREKDRKSLENW